MFPYLFSVLFMLSVDGISAVGAPALQAPADSSTAVSGKSAFIADFESVPAGFIKQKVSRKSPLPQPVASDSLMEQLFLKVNRVDRRHIPVGKEVLVPVDREKASRFSPVPTTLADFRGAREIRVFIDRQYFGAYEQGELLFWGPVSTGRQNHRTPTGKYQVQYKQRFKRSIKYDNAPMPFSINYNGGFFLHEQSLPGYPASHGCVRLMKPDAERLFSWSQLKDPVTLVCMQECK